MFGSGRTAIEWGDWGRSRRGHDAPSQKSGRIVAHSRVRRRDVFVAHMG